MTPSIPKGVALAFAVALGATLLMAAPVVLAPAGRLFGSGETLGREDPNRDALIVIEQFRAGRVPTPYLQPLTDLPGRALARLVGPVAAYNVLILATFPLSAAAAYLLARYVLGSHLGAMVAGLAYPFLPFHVSLACAALLCSLSPERRIGSLTFVRPSALLYEVAPMFRAYARFGVVVGLMTALLAGGGAAWLWQWPGSRGRLATVLLLGLTAFEYAPFPPWRWRDVLPTRAHRWLAAQPGSLRVLDCVPPSRGSDSLAVSLLGHEASLLGAPTFDDCGEPRLGDKLKAMGYPTSWCGGTAR